INPFKSRLALHLTNARIFSSVFVFAPGWKCMRSSTAELQLRIAPLSYATPQLPFPPSFPGLCSNLRDPANRQLRWFLFVSLPQVSNQPGQTPTFCPVFRVSVRI